MCENLTWSNYVRNQVLPVLWKCSKMHFLSLIFDMERSRLAKLWIRNNLEFMEWTIQNCPQMLFYVTCRHFYRPLKSCDIRFGIEEVWITPVWGPKETKYKVKSRKPLLQKCGWHCVFQTVTIFKRMGAYMLVLEESLHNWLSKTHLTLFICIGWNV